MAGSFAALDAGLPDPGGAESTERKLRALQDYLVLLLEQLRYVLRNLGAENFNAAALDAIGEKITAPIRAELGAFDPAIREIEAIHGPFRQGDIPHSLASIDKAARLLGYAPEFNVKDGLKAAAKWYYDHLHAN